MQLEGLVIPVSFGLGGLLKGVDVITDLISGAVSATFDWAEGMDKLGDVTGMTAQQTAAWSFVAKKAGVEVDTLANATVILTKGLFDSEGKLSTTGKALEDFGVGVMDANGNVKDSSTLMNDIAAKYQEFGTQTEKVDYLTNLFGRSGAQLVDMFDTLAQEGGIDAVSQKVKDLGLAIDPDRYEQFQRNLEELKLAGTGLAVQFTEALMPALESVMQWAQQFVGMSPEQIFQRISDIASTLPEKFEAWAKSVDWAQVSQDLIDGINNIDWAALGQQIGIAAGQIANGISAIISGVDWEGVFGAIRTAFWNFATGLGGGDLQTFKQVWSDNWAQLKQIAIGTFALMKSNASMILHGLQSEFSTIFATIGAGMITSVSSWSNNWDQMKQIVVQSIAIMRAAVHSWLAALPGMINTFFEKAYNNLQEWIAKMIGALGGLASSLAGGASSVGAAVGGLGSGITAHAAGGPGGGLTWVGENGPELVNLPNGSYVNNNQSSNRMSNQPVQAYIDYDELARTLARVLGQQMQRA